MHRVRKDHLSDEEIQNRTCSRSSSTKLLSNFCQSKIGLALVLVVQNSQIFAIYRPDNNVLVLQNSLYNVCVNSSSTKLKNNCNFGR